MDADAIFADIDAASEHVPFGNSAFQTAAFTGGHEGPERRARTLLLNMQQKKQALREARFRRRRLDIDLREIDAKLIRAKGFARERLLIDREEKTASLGDEDKLLRDAVIELEAMYREWKSLPPIESRDQFEEAEARYWTCRLWADACREIASHGAPAVGTIASLNQMGLAVQRDQGQWQLQGPAHLIAALTPPADQPKEITDGR